MRIGFLTHSAGLGGAEHSLRDLVVGVAAEDIEPVVYLPPAGPLWQQLQADGIACRTVEWPTEVAEFGDSPDVAQRRRLASLARIPGQMLVLGSRLRRQFHQDQIDALHTNSVKAEVAAGFAGTGLARVWYAKEAVWRRPVARRLLPCLPSRPRQIWACSEAVREDLGRIAARFQRDSAVVYNPFDLTPFQPQWQRRDLLPQAGAGLRLGLIGALTPMKGHLLFLQAARELLRRFPDLTFYIVGNDFAHNRGQARAAYADEVHRFAARPELAGRVVFTGARSDIPDVIASLDICVQASLLPDAYPRSVLEPLAMARPIVGPDEGGVPEILSHVSRDLLYRPGDAADLTRVLFPLLEHAGLRERMAAAGIQFMHARYAHPGLAQRAARIYRTLKRSLSTAADRQWQQL